MGHQRIMSIQIPITIAPIAFIKFVITKGSIYHIHAYTIGKFNGCCPIVLFDRLFGILVFTTEQPIRSLGSCTHKSILDVGSHTRKHLHTVRVFCIDVRIRIHEITGSEQIHLLEELDFIGIVETGINHRHMHTLSCKACCMKAIASMDVDLTERLSIIMTRFFHIVGHFLSTLLVTRRNTIGLCPHFLNSFHERLFSHFIHQ